MRLYDYAFVQAAMAASIAAFVWFCAAFPVGVVRGWRAGHRTLRSGLSVYALALAGIAAFAQSAGQLKGFTSALGTGQLLEMAVFVLIVLGVAYMMPSKYLDDRRREEEGDRGLSAGEEAGRA